MKRRTFLAGASAVAVTWPFAVRAQSAGRARRVGVLMMYREGDPEGQLRANALRKGLEERGWVVGRDVQIDFRWGVGDLEWLRSTAGDLLKSEPDVILANSDQAARATQAISRTVPTVFIAGSDPVGQGFVQSLAHPGGNLTGFSVLQPSLGPKWVELLREIAPAVRRIAMLINSENSGSMLMVRTTTEAAQKLGVEVAAAPIRTAPDIEAVMEMLARTPNIGLIVPADPALSAHRKLVVDLAARHRLPAVYALRIFANEGGLASYGISIPAVFRQASSYVDQILHGEKPGDLPVQRPTTFELVLNLRAATESGITLSPELVHLADELIE
jgi:putative ABC transport system substrate-binding protein